MYVGQFLPGCAGRFADLSAGHRPRCVLVSHCAPDSYFRYTSRGNPRWSGSTTGVRVGRTEAGRNALGVSRALTVVCVRRGCGSLVDYNAMCRAAAADSRDLFRPGDGCAGRRCAGRFNRGRFFARQAAWACALQSGGRLLLARPRRRSTPEFLLLSTPCTNFVAESILSSSST